MTYYQYIHFYLEWTRCVGISESNRSPRHKSIQITLPSDKPPLYKSTYTFYRKAKFTLANARREFGFFCYQSDSKKAALEGWVCYIAKYP